MTRERKRKEEVEMKWQILYGKGQTRDDTRYHLACHDVRSVDSSLSFSLSLAPFMQVDNTSPPLSPTPNY